MAQHLASAESRTTPKPWRRSALCRRDQGMIIANQLAAKTRANIASARKQG